MRWERLKGHAKVKDDEENEMVTEKPRRDDETDKRAVKGTKEGEGYPEGGD